MGLCTSEVSSMLRDTNDDVEFVMDMEEPVSKESEDENHQQDKHPHGFTNVFSKSSSK